MEIKNVQFRTIFQNCSLKKVNLIPLINKIYKILILQLLIPLSMRFEKKSTIGYNKTMVNLNWNKKIKNYIKF